MAIVAALLCALCAWMCLSTRDGCAQGRGASAARRAFERGTTALQLGRHAEALGALRESYELRPSPVVLYNIGLALRGLGRHREAIDAFERYLSTPERGADRDRLQVIRDEIAQLRRSLVHVSVVVRPSTATITIDGRAQTVASGRLDTDPGQHVIEIQAPGFRTWRQERNLRAGSEVVLDVNLEASSDGRLVVTPSIPDAAILIDGRRVGVGRADESVAPGAHIVEARASGFETYRRTVRVQAGHVIRLDAVLSRSAGGGVAVAVGLGVAGAAIAAVVIGLVVAGNAQAPGYSGNWVNVEAIRLP